MSFSKSEGIFKMGKQKTHKGLAKRIKITGSGKVQRKRAGNSHLMRTKNAKRRRRLSSTTIVSGVRTKKIREMLNA